MNRRHFIIAGASAAAIAAFAASTKGFAMFGFGQKEGEFPYELTDVQWQEKLSPESYRVLRKHGTETAFSSPLDKNTAEGIYHCAGCDQAAYSSAHKYDSGTGWPSFYQAISEDMIGTTTDYLLIYPRTEVHCSNCGGHFGHIFNDGPKPTGKRHCLNGVALQFKPA